MDCVQINMNNPAQVVLTKFGAECLNRYYSEFDAYHDWREIKEGKIYKGQLWELFQIFGERFYHGMSEVPFKDNVIEFI